MCILLPLALCPAVLRNLARQAGQLVAARRAICGIAAQCRSRRCPPTGRADDPDDASASLLPSQSLLLLLLFFFATTTTTNYL